MKRGELHHDGRVSFLTDYVVMTPKQHRVMLVGDDRASGYGIICNTCKEIHSGTQESCTRRDKSLGTSIVLKYEYSNFRINNEMSEKRKL